jgi:hypothetical protein
LQEPPTNYNICECCGTEFGVDDELRSHEELRDDWINRGAPWFFRTPPVGWNPWTQLLIANVGNLPYDASVSYFGHVRSFQIRVPENTIEAYADAA